MSLTARRVLQLAISIIVGAVCLWFAFRGVEGGASAQGFSLDDIQRIIAAVPLSTYAIYGTFVVAQFAFRTERWRLQVRGLTGTTPGWRDALAINAFSFAAVFLLPFRLGEFVRPNLCAQRKIMSASAGLAATALERVIDGLVTVALFGALLLFTPVDLPPAVRIGGLSALGVFGGAFVFFVAAFRFRAAALSIVRRVASVVSDSLADKLVAMVGGFLDGLACFNGPKDVVIYVGLSIAYWLLNGFGTLVVVRAIDPTASLDAGFFTLCFTVIGVMIPAPPGNVGNFHYFARTGLTLAGVALAPAVACAVLLHALTTVAVTLWGALFLVVGGFRWSDLAAAPPSEAPSK